MRIVKYQCRRCNSIFDLEDLPEYTVSGVTIHRCPNCGGYGTMRKIEFEEYMLKYLSRDEKPIFTRRNVEVKRISEEERLRKIENALLTGKYRVE